MNIEEEINKINNVLKINQGTLSNHNITFDALMKQQNQHGLVINLNRDRVIKSLAEMNNQIKAIQKDLDSLHELYHKLETLPNILEVLKDFEKIDKKSLSD